MFKLDCTFTGHHWEWNIIYLVFCSGDCRWWLHHEIKRCLLLWKKAMTNLDSILKSRDITLPKKVHLVKAMAFIVIMYGWMWELNYKESWVTKNWCFWTVVLEKTLKSPLDCKETQPVHPKGNQSWLFIGTTDAKAPILWPPDVKKWLIWKDPDAGKDWRQEEKWMTEDEMDASLTRWTWVWVISRSWWWTGRLGVLQSMQSQSRTQLSDWTELQWGQFPYVLFGYLSPFYPKGSSLLSFIALSWEAALGSFYTLFPNLVMVAYLYQKKWNMFQSHPTIDFAKGNGYMRALYHSSDSLY